MCGDCLDNLDCFDSLECGDSLEGLCCGDGFDCVSCLCGYCLGSADCLYELIVGIVVVIVWSVLIVCMA